MDSEDREESLGSYEVSENTLDPDNQASKEPTLLFCSLDAVSITLETVSGASIDDSELQRSITGESITETVSISSTDESKLQISITGASITRGTGSISSIDESELQISTVTDSEHNEIKSESRQIIS